MEWEKEHMSGQACHCDIIRFTYLFDKIFTTQLSVSLQKVHNDFRINLSTSMSSVIIIILLNVKL